MPDVLTLWDDVEEDDYSKVPDDKEEKEDDLPDPKELFVAREDAEDEDAAP